MTKNTTEIAFTNKTEYLAWRARWKADYHELSTEIRQSKTAIKLFMRDQCYAGCEQGRLRAFRTLAKKMLTARQLSKVEAQRQYLAAKQVAIAR